MKRPSVWILLLFLALGIAACLPHGSDAPSSDVSFALADRPAGDPTITAGMPELADTTPPVLLATPSPASATFTPTLALSPTPGAPACLSQGGQVRRDYLLDKRLSKPLEYLVYLPPCYQQQPERRYPVLYLIHGQSFTHEQWDRLGADEAADALIAAGRVAPFIIVMPRDRLWTSPRDDPFGDVLADRLVPDIDASYRSLPDRAFRAIGGLSRGAGWAVHLGLTRWDLFGAIGAHSPVVFWSDSSQVRVWLKDIPPESLPRFYLDIGEKDRPEILESATWFESVLTEEGIAHEWHLFPGYHEEDYWQAHVEDYLRWYAAEW